MPYNPPPAIETRIEQPSIEETLRLVNAIEPPDPLEALRQANAKESYEWLGINSQDHLEAVQQAVNGGATPDQIYRFMLRDTFRHEIAHRCRLAARWLAEQAG